MAKQQTTRNILVLNRYAIRQDCPERGLHKGDVVLHISNDKEKEYYTSLRRNKAHSCSCTGNAIYGRNCYHIKDLSEMENARYTAAKAVKAIEMPAQPVVDLASQAEAEFREGKVWSEACGCWVTPPCEDLADVVDVETTLSNWDAIKRQAKDRNKAQIRAQMREVTDLSTKGNLNVSRGFALMR